MARMGMATMNQFKLMFNDRAFGRLRFQLLDGFGNTHHLYVPVCIKARFSSNCSIYTGRPIKTTVQGIPLHPYDGGFAKETEPKINVTLTDKELSDIILAYMSQNPYNMIKIIRSTLEKHGTQFDTAYVNWISKSYERLTFGPVFDILE